MLDLKELQRRFHYDPETGVFTRKVRMGRTSIGSFAGTKNREGYLAIHVGHKKYLAHRLAWLCVTGNWPKQYIDHKNGIKHDNRICNLQDVSRSVNGRNTQKHREGKLPWCTFVEATKKWTAQITVNGKQKYLGCYDTQQQAHDRSLSQIRMEGK